MNSVGDYDCTCKPGFVAPSETADLKRTNCVEMCNQKTCKHGRCQAEDGVYRCKCEKGYIGFNCEIQEVDMAGATAMRTALIIISIIGILSILFSVLMVHKYRVLRKRSHMTSNLNDASSTIELEGFTTFES
ncbi:neurogenic locus notch homolog protein 1-like [Parasteatoda tepidariorum]|uniref:neurogenic locus notch homolog protein 1-like n=1 Tax=Parasteatoda tepidariorum TaxID=114398 RepID=UPI001C72615F|nr:delta and Notch-like epidermal growth factor-related receptor [Parasteatoda tepidariorum]